MIPSSRISQNIPISILYASLFFFLPKVNFGQDNFEDLNNQAYALRYENIDSALNLNKSLLLKFSEIQDLSLKSDILSVRGVLLKGTGAYDESTKFHLAALDIRREIKDSAGIGGTLNNIGNNFFLLGQIEKAKEYHLESLNIKKKLGDTLRIISTLNNLGNDYKKLGEIDKALDIYQEGLILSGTNYEFEAADFLLNRGILFNAIGDWEKAIEDLNESIKIQKEIGDDYGRAMSLHNLGISFEGLEKYDSSKVCYSHAEKLLNKIEDLELKKDIQKSKVILWMKTSGNNDILEEFQHYNTLNDSFTNQIIDSKTAELEAKYENAKNKAENELITTENSLMKAEKEQNLLIIWGLVLLLMIVIILVAILIRLSAQKRKIVSLELAGKKQEIEQLMRGYELDLFEAQNFGQQEERQRIATDLHDRLGGLLAAVNLQIENFANTRATEFKTELKRIKEMVSEGISEVRNVSHNMRAEALKSHGLKGALEAICNSITSAKDLHIELFLDDLDEDSGQEVEREVYKIIMELLSNTLKHANAKHVTVQINEIEKNLNIVYEDDGKGFTFDKSSKSGLGMHSIDARVKKLKGDWQVDSHPNRGTTIIINIPRL